MSSSSNNLNVTAFIKESKHLVIPLRVIKKGTKKFTTVIGKGVYGLVYKGELLLSGELTSVAVKRLDSNISGQGFKEFLTEIQLLSRYKHPNVVSLVGFCDEAGEKILVYEYAQHGSLDKHLSVAKTAPPLPWEQRIRICLDTARGLDYLHNRIAPNHRVIHRDIKSANILIGHDWKAMIADLGLSKIGRSNENDSYLITNASGTHGYCDPAYMHTGILTKESDVYSFGVVMFEVLCGRLGFMNVNNEHRFLAPLAQRYYETGRLNEIIDPYLKIEVDSNSLKRFSEIAYPCLLNERNRRPSMGLVVQKLEEIMESLKVLQRTSKVLNLSQHGPSNQAYYVLGHKTANIRDVYTLGQKLGQGQFGTTYMCTEIATGKSYACKSISKRKLISMVDVDDVRREIQIMHHLAGHKNIVTIKGSYEDALYIHIVMELCNGGELFDRIIQRGHYSERKAAELTKIIVGVVEACHSLGVMHRDLKPEKFLLVNKNDDFSLKAIDFGQSVFFKPGQIFKDVVGTPYYVAPEVLLKHYGPEADVWTAGVILYVLLSGVPPFWAAGEKILVYEYAQHGSLDKHLSVAKTARPLPWEQRIRICFDTARGLDYLHNHIAPNHRVIHRDIKSANILIGNDWKAMIADLGLSKIGRANESDSYLITNASGTHGYCDPAYMHTGILTKESDVYSFGVVMFEVLCGRLGFMNVNNEHRFLAPLAQRYYETGRLNEIIDPYLKIEVDSNSLKRFSEIAYPCLLNERNRRPSMGLVVQKLEEIMESLKVLQRTSKVLNLSQHGPSNQAYYVLGHKTANIRDVYTLGQKLGQGQFGTTYMCTEIATGKSYACKSISKRKLISMVDVDNVRREIQIMHHLAGHKNIVTIKGSYEDALYIHIVMELCNGGELFDRIIQRGHYSERKAAELTKIIIGVVEACHSLGVMHRDLKPEKFLLVNKNDDFSLKAIDFGQSVFFKPGQIFKDVVGTPYYVAPEVLLKHYGPEADVWTAGVILYVLLSGVPPFWAETQQGIYDAVLKGFIDFESDPWPLISDGAKDLIRKMLCLRPSDRLTPHEVLCHPWICENSLAPDRALDPSVLSRMKQFSAMNNLKKMGLRVIAESLSEDEIAGLREIFKSIDTDNSGTITFNELKAGVRKYGSTMEDIEILDLMNAADVDNSGTIDYGEFLAATINLNKLEREEHLVAAFQYFDKNGNGYITVDELQQAGEEHGMADLLVEDIIREVDQDNDGRIDYREFVDMMSKGNAGVG